MDSIFDIIGPLVIAAIYFLSNFLSKKGEEEDVPPDLSQRLREEEDLREQNQRRAENEARQNEMAQREQFRQKAKATTKVTLKKRVQNPTPERQHQESSGDFHWDTPNDSYDSKMERQMKKIEETKRKAALLLSKSDHNSIQSAEEKGSSGRRQKKTSLGSVRSSLKDPSAARVAFIYGEVLGPPVSLRETTGVPGLTS